MRALSRFWVWALRFGAFMNKVCSDVGLGRLPTCKSDASSVWLRVLYREATCNLGMQVQVLTCARNPYHGLEREPASQPDRQTDRPTDKQPGRRAVRQTDGQMIPT